MIIQIIGLPRSGKTSRATLLRDRTNGIHLNADEIRADLNKDLGFELKDRIENARRIGAMARLLSNQGHIVIVDFVCPTEDTREAFGKADVVIWIARTPNKGSTVYEDTSAMWEDPKHFDMMVTNLQSDIEQSVDEIIARFGLPDYKAPTTLMLGRFQPWHDGHQALYHEAQQRTTQVLIGVRNTYCTSPKDPFEFQQVRGFIQDRNPNAFVVRMPNITNIIHGRDVGYKIEHIKLSAELEAISATEIRKKYEGMQLYNP